MITGASPGEVAKALREALQRAVSCVSANVLVLRPFGIGYELTLMDELARRGVPDLVLSIRYAFAVVSDAERNARSRWQARPSGYIYMLAEANGHEILAYHWHPQGRSHVTTPHLHFGAGAGALRRELQKAHLTTGQVTLVAMLRLLIESFAVQPRRMDAVAVLERAEMVLGDA